MASIKLADALAVLNRVSAADVRTELVQAETELQTVKIEARKVFTATVRQALDKVKMLRRLKMSKEKAGKPLGKRKGKA